MLITRLFPPPPPPSIPPAAANQQALVASPPKVPCSAQEAAVPPSMATAAQGEYQQRRSLMQPANWVLQQHPFMKTLVDWASGVPVDCGDPWPMEAILLAVARGPHRSALTVEARALIADKIAYQVQAGFSEIMEWETVRQLAPKQLKVSPLAVIPQANRRGRLLLDLSFPVHRYPTDKPRHHMKQSDGHMVQPSVNATTTPLSPMQPVKELGQVLPRLLDFLAAVPPHEIIHLAKIDLSDGFWRMVVKEPDKWNFAYVLPGEPSAPIRLVIPHALQMGWTESPGYFCAATETGRDIIQQLVHRPDTLPPHGMEHFMTPTAPAQRQRSATDTQWQMTSVYVDDYILAAVEDTSGSLLRHISRAALHTIHAIFPPPAQSGHHGGKDPISEKKLAADDARWAPEKVILGFVVNGATRTVCLSVTKAADLAKAITCLLKKNRTAIKKFQSLVGRLRHAASILPAARSLFTPINRALQGSPKLVALGKANSELRAALQDLRTLVLDLSQRPTHVHELVIRPPDYIGYCDASAFGAGGVWFSGARSLVAPTVWRTEWPTDIQTAVVSASNPTGRLTNSDLEMAAVFLHFNVLETQVTTLRHCNVIIHSDNSPSVAWATTMATKSAKSDAAHRLLRGMAMRQRAIETGPLQVVHIAGKSNTLADIASRPIPALMTSSNPYHILAACLPHAQSALQCDFDTARAAIAVATVDHSARTSSWRWWTHYCSECCIDPWMQTCTPAVQQQVLLGFAARVRTGFFGSGRPVGAQSVEKALRHVAQARLLAGLGDPRRTSGRSDLDLPFAHLLKSFRDNDPAPKPQLALPVMAIEAAAAVGLTTHASLLEQATADLIILAFFFLLRVGEYTLPPPHTRTRTTQFRVCDVKFWAGQVPLPHHSTPAILLTASSVTLTIDNQKNGQRGQTMHHVAIPGAFCPVKAAARRVSHIIVHLHLPPTSPLSTVWPQQNLYVRATDVLSTVRKGACTANLTACGYDVSRIGAHSLRASGAMALWLSGHPAEAIMKLGRWKSNTYLTYIHSQIAAISQDTSARMRRPISFHNVGG